ncbi:MAG: hypothetical protein M3Z54_01565 [Gemmatimonadota bacterium]|nr:hypothetical protein [Gemmatimonadota bacterium]
MARKNIRELHVELRSCRFGFIGRGEHTLDDIYRRVRDQFTALCDDRYLCADNCSRGHQQPEWKHEVRRALDALKSQSGPIRKSPRRGYWRFH